MCHSEKGEIIPKCIAESSKVNIVNKEIVFVSRHFVKGLNTTHSKYVQFYISFTSVIYITEDVSPVTAFLGGS